MMGHKNYRELHDRVISRLGAPDRLAKLRKLTLRRGYMIGLLEGIIWMAAIALIVISIGVIIALSSRIIDFTMTALNQFLAELDLSL